MSTGAAHSKTRTVQRTRYRTPEIALPVDPGKSFADGAAPPSSEYRKHEPNGPPCAHFELASPVIVQAPVPMRIAAAAANKIIRMIQTFPVVVGRCPLDSKSIEQRPLAEMCGE